MTNSAHPVSGQPAARAIVARRRSLLVTTSLTGLAVAGLIAVAALPLTGGQALAGTAYWDGGDVAADNVVDGGGGTWTTAGTNWTNVTGAANGTLAVTSGGAPITAIFGTTGGTVELDNNFTINTLQFDVNGYSIVNNAGGTVALTLTGGAINVTNAGQTANIGVRISGSGTITIGGAGTTVFNAGITNNYTANLQVNGALVIASGGLQALGNANAATLTVNTGGSVDLGASSQGVNGFTMTGGTISNGTLALSNDAVTHSGGTVNANVRIQGVSTYTLSGTGAIQVGAQIVATTFQHNGGNSGANALVTTYNLANGNILTGATIGTTTFNQSGGVVQDEAAISGTTFTQTAGDFGGDAWFTTVNLNSGNVTATAEIAATTISQAGSNVASGAILSAATYNHSAGTLNGAANVSGTYTLSGTGTVGATGSVNAATIAQTNGDMGGTAIATTYNHSGGNMTGGATAGTYNLSAAGVVGAAGTVDATTFNQTGGAMDGTAGGGTYNMTGGTVGATGVVNSFVFAQTGGTVANYNSILSDIQVIAVGGTITAAGPGGIDVDNIAPGGITITTSAAGNINNAGGVGIDANTVGGAGIINILLNGTVTGSTTGILAQSSTDAYIVANNDVLGSAGAGIQVNAAGNVWVQNQGGSGTTIQGNGGAAVQVNTTATTGQVLVQGSSGTLIGTPDGTNIVTGGADITVDQWDQIFGQAGDGVDASSFGGDIAVTGIHFVQGTGGNGLNLNSGNNGGVANAGDISVQGSGLGWGNNNGIIGTGGAGILADATGQAGTGGNINIGTLTLNGVIQGSGDGIEATTNGAGAITIVTGTNAGGVVTGLGGDGMNLSTTAGAIAVTTGAGSTTQGTVSGINASSTTGNQTIIANGNVLGQGGNGMQLTATTGTIDVTVAAGATVQGFSGITASTSGGGSVAATVNGNVIASNAAGTGLAATTNGGAGTVTIDGSGVIQGGINGIVAGADNGATTIQDLALVHGTTGDGINSVSDDGDITVQNVAAVEGGLEGIDLDSNGGNISIQGLGTVTGTGGSGIFADASFAGAGGNILIGSTSTNGVVQGGTNGIVALTDGTGLINIATGNNVIGATGNGIQVGSGTTTTLLMNFDVFGGTNAILSQSGALTATNNATIQSNLNAYNITGGTGVFNNNGNVLGSVMSSAGVTSNTINNNGIWSLTAAGASNLLGGNDTVVNNGAFNVQGNLVTGLETFTNNGSGLLNLDGTNSFTVGTLTNSGLVDMQDGSMGGVVNVGTNLGGTGGIIAMDMNLTTAVGDTDQVVLAGGATSSGGSATVVFSGMTGAIQAAPTLVLDLEAGSTFAATAQGLGDVGLVQYVFGQDANSDYVITSQLNLAPIGGIVGGISSAQALINTNVNRPSSAFVASPIGVDPDTCAPGAYARLFGGQSTAEATTSSAVSSDTTSEVDLTYGGAQFGADFGCFNIGGKGAAINLGLLGGVNIGKASQDQSFTSGVGPNQVVSRLISETEFESHYVGAYATYTKGSFFADAQVVYDRTALDITSTNTTTSGGGSNTASLVNGQTPNSDRITASGSLGYAFSIDSISIVPSAGVAYSRTKTDAIMLDNNAGVLAFDDLESVIGFASVAVAKTFILPNETSALQTFVTLTGYNDFGQDQVVTYFDAVNTVATTTENIGMFGELSAGLNYRAILAGDGATPREVSASMRGDVSFSDRLLGWRATLQGRIQF